MKGLDLWSIFLSATVPDSELEQLGEDIGYLIVEPSQKSKSALLKIAYAFRQRGVATTADSIFIALKSEMPGILSRKGLLHAIANDYQTRRPYPLIQAAVRGYFDAVAAKFPNPTKAAPVDPGISVKISKSSLATPAIPGEITASHQVIVDPPPTGIHPNEWEFIKIVTSRLANPETSAQISNTNIAAARNLAERAGLVSTVQALDAEIERRGEGAQPAESQSSSTSSPKWTGLLAFLGIGILFLFARN